MQTGQAIVTPGGTGTPRFVISARFAPLPPSTAFMSLVPSADPPPKKYTDRSEVAVATLPPARDFGAVVFVAFIVGCVRESSRETEFPLRFAQGDRRISSRSRNEVCRDRWGEPSDRLRRKTRGKSGGGRSARRSK